MGHYVRWDIDNVYENFRYFDTKWELDQFVAEHLDNGILYEIINDISIPSKPPRFYALFRLKEDGSHVELYFYNEEELDKFRAKWSHLFMPFDTEIVDFEKMDKEKKSKIYGVIFGIGWLILIFWLANRG